MTGTRSTEAEEISLFAVGTRLLRNRWRILRWTFIGGLLALASVILKPPVYVASASFIPQGNDTGRSSLTGLAGQFGLALPTGNLSVSPEFYSKLLKSRVLLLPIVRDTFVVKELGGKRVPFLDLFKIEGNSVARREEEGVTRLQNLVGVSVARTTGVVELSVVTEWPSVSLAIAASLMKAVNDYNERIRRGQATAERQFVENRLAEASADLRAAEDRMEAFLRANRQIGDSPELTFGRDRLQRDISLRQQVFTSLTQSYDEARIREVRNSPVVSVFEPPAVPTEPQPRGRLKRVLLGLVLGASAGALLVLASQLLARRREEGDVDAREFVAAFREMKRGILRPFSA